MADSLVVAVTDLISEVKKTHVEQPEKMRAMIQAELAPLREDALDTKKELQILRDTVVELKAKIQVQDSQTMTKELNELKLWKSSQEGQNKVIGWMLSLIGTGFLGLLVDRLSH